MHCNKIIAYQTPEQRKMPNTMIKIEPLHIENMYMYCVSIELSKQEWKFGE